MSVGECVCVIGCAFQNETINTCEVCASLFQKVPTTWEHGKKVLSVLVYIYRCSR